jgi:DNA-binding CsgD family transcriptional regulator
MVGREGELALLAAAFDRAKVGEAQVAVVRGVAGIGKTRLVRELVTKLPGAPTVAFGHALPPPGGSLSFGVCADLLRSVVREMGVESVRGVLGPRASVMAPLVPLLGAGAEGALDRFALMATTQDLLCELPDEAAPLLLVVEDAHWCDSSSMELLGYWARSLVRARVMILMTTRTAVDDDSVAGQLGAVERLPNATVIEVSPLDGDQVREQALALDPAITSARLGTVRVLSEGNPLYVEELVAHGGDGISRAVALDLSAGLRALSASTVRVLDMLALETRPVETATLAELTVTPREQVEQALDEAFARGLVARRGATSWQFHHELLRRAAVDSQAPSSQVAGHRAWAEHLDALENPRLGDLVASASHWVNAGDRRRAFLAFWAAARVSDMTAPSEEAFALWRSALTLTHDDPGVASEAEHREVFGRACAILISSADWVAVVEAEKAAVPHATGTLGWFLRCWTYNMERRLGNDPPAFLSREQLNAVRNELLDDPPDALLAATLYEVFMTASWLRYPDQMEATADALAQVDAALPPEVSAGMDVALVARLGTLRGRENAVRRLEVAERAVETSRDRDWATLSWRRGTYAAELISQGRLDEGLAQAEASMALVPGEENESHWYIGALNAIWALWLRGRWDASLGLARRAQVDGMAKFQLVQATARRGEPAALVSEGAEAHRSAANFQLIRLCRRLAAAQSSVQVHDQQAPTRLREALDDLPVLDLRSGEGLILLAEMASDLPAPDPVLDTALRESAESLLRQGALDDAWLVHLDVVLRRHHGTDDPETWRRAVQTWDEIGAPVEAARCRLPLGEKLLSAGDRDGAAYELSQALLAFDSVGATPSSAAVRRLAGRARLRLPGDHTRAAPERGGLTEREYDVLQLLVVGSTNDKIAAALYMSPKTVSVHVSHILQKLGAANRTEVSSIAHQHGLIETS